MTLQRPRIGRFTSLVAAAAALVRLLAPPPPAAGQGQPRGSEAVETDRATLRRIAVDEWYNETSSRGRGRKALGSPFSARYMRFLNEAAARERARWGETLPTASES